MTAIDSDVKEVEKMFAVNVFGPIRMVHIFHPLLIRARGTIVNIGSVGGIVPYVYGCGFAPHYTTQGRVDSDRAL
jgi:1-acylglycerone phosphate reductase